MPAPKITSAAARNALEGAIAAGLRPTAAVWMPDGSYRVEFGSQDSDPDHKASAANASRTPKQWGKAR